MDAEKTQKNALDNSQVSAQGDVNIGDRTTINVYGLKADQKDLEFIMKVYVVLIALFAIATIAFMIVPEIAKRFPDDYIRSFAAGGFFALGSIILIMFLRSKKQSSLTKKISDGL